MRNAFFILILISATALLNNPVFSQTDTSKTPVKRPKYYIMETDTVPTLLLKPDSVITKKKKVPKIKKKVFYGFKCKKGFIRTISGNNVTIESFYFLKVWKDPNPMIPDLYVWDISKNKILKVSKIEAEKKLQYRVLNGPYSKEVNGNVIATGSFYVGTMHARWALYNKEFILLDKTTYYKGWPREAKMSYYDGEHKKIKEVMPYEYGKLQGDYYLFDEKGMVITKGQYENAIKVGLWVDFFPNSVNRKREIKYPSDPYDKETQPIVQKEWDEKGRVIIIGGKIVPEGSKQQEEEDPIKKRLKKSR
ncbi:MAG: hypothetical protein H7259_06465 [Cytophagales bacterium]|nr:hypothetical protein [Cytophaga sp.]